MTAVDPNWLEDLLTSVLRADTQVPLGETEVLAGDPRIVAAVDEVILPMVEELGPDEVRRHPAGDVAARFGPPGDDGLLIQTYVVSQHANLMDPSLAGQVVDGAPYGLEGPCALGQGATQNKGPMAAAFAAVRARPEPLERPVWLALNAEGRSSHGGSRRVIDELEVRAAHGLVAFGTDLRVSLGNRGRVDVEVTVVGRSCHSSQPWLGSNAIEGAADVVRLLRTAPLPKPHPLLGPASATPYQLSCHPVAPHTIPERARVVLDRRLLPGEDPERATEDLRRHLAENGLGDLDVAAGVSMLPAEVREDETIVRALLDGLRAAGRKPQTFWSLNAFDAGYACAKGIPTPMFGPGKRRFAGEGLTGTDAIALPDCVAAAEAIAHAIVALCGPRAGAAAVA